MIQVRQEALQQLEAAWFDSYVEDLTQRLRDARYKDALQRAFQKFPTDEELNRHVRATIDTAFKLGIFCKGDVTPFVLMSVVLSGEFRSTGLWDWVEATVEATEYPAENRMDAVYALLPDHERDLCFSNVS